MSLGKFVNKGQAAELYFIEYQTTTALFYSRALCRSHEFPGQSTLRPVMFRETSNYKCLQNDRMLNQLFHGMRIVAVLIMR